MRAICVTRAHRCAWGIVVCVSMCRRAGRRQSARQHTCMYTSTHHAYKKTRTQTYVFLRAPLTCIAVPVNQHILQTPALLHQCVGMSVDRGVADGVEMGIHFQGMCQCASVSVLREKVKSHEGRMHQCGGGGIHVPGWRIILDKFLCYKIRNALCYKIRNACL